MGQHDDNQNLPEESTPEPATPEAQGGYAGGSGALVAREPRDTGGQQSGLSVWREDRSVPREPLSWRVPAATALLVMAGWLYLGQLVLEFPDTAPSLNSSLRTSGAAIVVALAALWIRQVGRSVVATSLIALAGALLFIGGLALAHDVVRTQADEIVSGIVLLALAAASLLE